MNLIIGAALFALVGWYVRFYWKWRKGPPGPLPVPVLGNLIQMGIAGIGVTPNLAISNLSKKYGDIFRLSIGLTDYIVLSSYDVMADIRNRKEAQGKLVLGIINDRNQGQNSGIGFAEGTFVETTKKWVFGNLHRKGLSKHGGLEEIVHQAVSDLAEVWGKRLANSGGNSAIIDNLSIIGRYASSVIMSFVLGDKLNTPKFQTHFDRGIENTEEWLKAGIFGAGLDQALPFLGSIFPSLVGKEMSLRTTGVIRAMGQDLLDDLRKDMDSWKKDPSENKSLGQLFLEKIESKENPDIFSDFHFQSLFVDLFQATYDTQNATVKGALLFSIVHPQYQQRMFGEIQKTIGRDEPVKMEHRKSMPFTEAFIHECHRHMKVLPNYLPTKLTADIEYGKFRIPMGTGILADVHTAYFNKKDWTNPEDFNPERFINEEGEIDVGKKKYCNPFGIGKRSCPGEPIGDTIIFIFFVTLLKNFKVSAVPGKGLPRTDMEVGITSGPYPFDMMIQERVW